MDFGAVHEEILPPPRTISSRSSVAASNSAEVRLDGAMVKVVMGQWRIFGSLRVSRRRYGFEQLRNHVVHRHVLGTRLEIERQTMSHHR